MELRRPYIRSDTLADRGEVLPKSFPDVIFYHRREDSI